jgi:hypothetical protein
MPDGTTSWTISVSTETDADVQAYLAEHGMTTEDLSKFVERTVRWKLFDSHMAEARRGFADMSPDEFEALIDEALTAARAGEISDDE